MLNYPQSRPTRVPDPLRVLPIRTNSQIRASDVECPTCEAVPGRNCKDRKFPDVHMTRAIRASNEQGRSSR